MAGSGNWTTAGRPLSCRFTVKVTSPTKSRSGRPLCWISRRYRIEFGSLSACTRKLRITTPFAPAGIGSRLSKNARSPFRRAFSSSSIFTWIRTCSCAECSTFSRLSQLTAAAASRSRSALAFATALKATRDIDSISPLQDAVYVEKFSRLLPTYGITSRADDDVILGYWLTGGARVSAKSFRRLRQTLSWMGAKHLRDVVQAAGFEVSEVMPVDEPRPASPIEEPDVAQAEMESSERISRLEPNSQPKPFELPGRPELEEFFNEHVIDIIRKHNAAIAQVTDEYVEGTVPASSFNDLRRGLGPRHFSVTCRYTE